MLPYGLLPLLLLLTPATQPALPAAFEAPPILMYHRVDRKVPADPVGRQLTVTPDQFQDQLAYLHNQGVAVLSMAQMQQRLQSGQPLAHTVVITFDDGYEDQYTYALPVLRANGARATFYIITGQVGHSLHLTWKQIRTLAAQHMDIAAHGVQHDDLSQMTAAQQTYQIDGSVQVLQHFLHARIASYAYPSGRFNRTTLDIVRNAGIVLAVTTDPVYILPPENRFEISRVRVRGDWSIQDFAAALRSAASIRHIVRR